MKKIYFLLLLTAVSQAQIVAIPDADFKAKLLAATASNYIALNGSNASIEVDANHDGEIQVSEAQSVSVLNIQSASIVSLEGIGAFSNLSSLICYQNQIAEIPVLPNLTTLNCAQNQITGIPVLPSLVSLTCGQNQIAILDVSSLNNLQFLDCSDNAMTSLLLDIGLKWLDCSNNQLTALDLNGSGYTSLDISYNQLTDIVIPPSDLHNGVLDISGNLYTSVDFSNVKADSPNQKSKFLCNDTQLQNLDFFTSYGYQQYIVSNNPNLQFINFKNGRSEKCLDTGGTGPPSLACLFVMVFQNDPAMIHVCADDDIDGYSEMAFIHQNVFEINQPIPATLSTYCSFEPWATWNSIPGTIRLDADGNGCDSGDIPQPYVKMKLNDGTHESSIFTNYNGHYDFYTREGNFTVTPAMENPDYFTLTPASATVDFAAVDGSASEKDFCLVPNGIHPDIEVVLMQLDRARPGFDAKYRLTVKNNGNQVLSGSMRMTYNDDVLDFSTATQTPDAQSSGNLSWDYSNLPAFGTKSVNLVFHLNTPTDTPAVNIGDVLNFTAAATPTLNDETPADNNITYSQTVTGSFDPNGIICMEGEVAPVSKIGDYLHYAVNFENTGTAEAENIVVTDVIDTTKFDVGSLQLLSASGPVEARVTGNRIEFIFEGIGLPAGSHGDVAFKIKTKSTLAENASVANQANIYFDYNAAVPTNVANTVFQTLGVNENTRDLISVWPNPVHDAISIQSADAVREVELLDLQGRMLQSGKFNENQVVFDISAAPTGIYFVRIIFDKGMKTMKVVKK